MAAGKLNYIVVHKKSSQVYGSASKKIALESPPPDGCKLEDKRIYFITHEPDTGDLVVYQVPHDEVINAELKEKKANE
jgi:hypothetical protein